MTTSTENWHYPHDEVQDVMHQFIVCPINKIPHLVLDGRTGKYIQAHGLPNVECYSRYPMPNWPTLKLQQDVFGNESLVSSINEVIAYEDERLNELHSANEEEWNRMISREKTLDDVAKDLKRMS